MRPFVQLLVLAGPVTQWGEVCAWVKDVAAAKVAVQYCPDRQWQSWASIGPQTELASEPWKVRRVQSGELPSISKAVATDAMFPAESRALTLKPVRPFRVELPTVYVAA